MSKDRKIKAAGAAKQPLLGREGPRSVIASVVWDMGADIARQKSVSSMLILAAAFVLSCVCKVNVVYIVLGCIALGTARTLLGRRKAG